MRGRNLPYKGTRSWGTNFGLGAAWDFVDLDKSGPLASELRFTGAADPSELAGPGTDCPVAMSLAHLAHLFYRVKRNTITGTVAGMADAQAPLLINAVPVTVWPGPRAALLAEPTYLFATPLELNHYFLDLRPRGYRYSGQIYPQLLAQDAFNSGAVMTKTSPGKIEVGTFTIYGCTCPLWGVGFATGDITVAEDLLWP